MTFLEKAIEDGLVEIRGEGKKQDIFYLTINHSERYSDPEERVRAEYWAELVYRYNYKPERIGVEITVPDRTPSDRADLVVFADDSRVRPYAVIECKPDGITESEFEQAVEQACGNGTWAKFRAKYIGVVAGGHRRRFLDFSSKYGVLEREANKIADLPKSYGKPEEWRFRKNTNEDIAPVSREDLIKTIRNCHQSLWGGGRLSPPAAFGEFCKLLFVKISDETGHKNGEPYQFQVKTHEENHKLAERIRALYRKAQSNDPDVFVDTIRVDDGVLRTLVEHMESINFTKTDLDTKGVAFEQFTDGFFKGDFGQYFTPREIIAFAVSMLGPNNQERVLDPACGSGGFLLYSLDYVRREAAEYHDFNERVAIHKHWYDFAQRRLFGIEINDEIARVAKMNMIVHDDGHTNVIGMDALDKMEKLNGANRGIAKDSFDLVLTNPPFGNVIKRSEKPYLTDYELSRHVSESETNQTLRRQRDNVKSEILFIERVWQFLKPGIGRAAIVLPDGILTNDSMQGVRDWLMKSFKLLAVVSLPQSAFSHYGAGVKASIVFLQKRAFGEAISNNEMTFMAVASNIGYDATGRKTHRISLIKENKKLRVEKHGSDLFDWEVDLAWLKNIKEKGDWREVRRKIIPDSGLIRLYRRFLDSSSSFNSYGRKTPLAFGVKSGDLRRLDPQFVAYKLKPKRDNEAPLGSLLLSGDEGIQTGKRPKGGVRHIASGALSIGAEHIGRDGRLDLSNPKFVPDQFYQNATKGKFAVGDILMCKDGALTGKVCYVDKDSYPSINALVNEHVYILRADAERIRQEYLFWYFYSEEGQERLMLYSTGSAQPGLSRGNLAQIEIPVPNMEKQDVLINHMRKEHESRYRQLAEIEKAWSKAIRYFSTTLHEKHE